MKNIIFIAPPSAGKGTQSEMLMNNYGYTHLSTGDLLREVAKEDSDLGKKIALLMSKGELISDDIINELLQNKLSSISGNFILDGYPRTLTQAEALNEMLKSMSVDDYVVIYLDINEHDAMERALGRITCTTCSTIYNIYYEAMKPKEEGICDKCNSELIQRSDDNEETFRVRFNTYVENATPIMDYYEKLGVLKKVNVEDGKDATYKNLEEVLND